MRQFGAMRVIRQIDPLSSYRVGTFHARECPPRDSAASP